MDHLEQKKEQPADDPTAAARKRDHIDMAFRSQVLHAEVDGRFHYEPLLSAHPQPGSLQPFPFLGKTLRTPLWVSSMTGGTDWAHTINHNLARACAEFGMGMGLGSCRSLLFSDDTLEDFAVRHLIGDELPLYANLGVAQLEQLIDKQELGRVTTLLEKLQADGLIIHVNPLQEWMQPEGDRFQRSPLETILTLLEKLPDVPLIVKEVGQGMGPASLRALLQLPLQAVDFAAAGGTNFAKLELLRSEEAKANTYGQLAQVGHTAAEMVQFTNQIAAELGDQMRCRQIIISGGIGGFLDGFYLMKKLQVPSVYGQASGFLKHARGSYEELREYVAAQVRGLELAEAFLIQK
ncbi:MAG: type 2 isopentenyl-diphosphate Delta-isomerase [Saprospiraceae bacterium]|nr:type 2 isopentenyl-diphosphate Delta-isomerase [Saprospiraceae bacterium]